MGLVGDHFDLPVAVTDGVAVAKVCVAANAALQQIAAVVDSGVSIEIIIFKV